MPKAKDGAARASSTLVPLAWKDRKALIEVAFPAQKMSIEAQTERKAGAGQTLTALGSYWKGRKPLVLVRACVLASLLPVDEADPSKDLEVFELLMAMDDDAFVHRQKAVSKEDVLEYAPELATQLLEPGPKGDKWKKLKKEEKQVLLGEVLKSMPYAERLNKRSLRPEELDASAYDGIWERVNAHLGTHAASHAELVEQLGILRFGHRPKVADTFSGGGSIPFEAARVGCDVFASDLNPIACMLTWGAFNVIGADEKTRAEIKVAQEKIAADVDAEITALGIEHDGEGNRAKAYLYCLEATCPSTGWSVPLAGSWVVSRNQRVVAQLVPDPALKRFEIQIVHDASPAQIEEAENGTVQDGELVFKLDGVEYRTLISTLRGDRRVDGGTLTNLRKWSVADFQPGSNDTFRERLYCVQWMREGNSRKFFYAGVRAEDLAREQKVSALVASNLAGWQAAGFVPDSLIEAGDKTDEPIRTRGWAHWHHLFNPRQLLVLSTYRKAIAALPGILSGACAIPLAELADKNSRLCRWKVGHGGKAGVAPGGDYPEQTFYNQALNTLYNYAVRSWGYLASSVELPDGLASLGNARISTATAGEASWPADVYITDPPYADAVRYEELTDFFIAWLRKNPPEPFKDWVWDSRRTMAIKGTGEDFRREMVKAYKAMTEHMPDNGLQIIMFTHQDAKVWADLASILWGAGLRVTGAWYIATETTSELKKGGYVQGTVLLVARKRMGQESAYADELVVAVRSEVEAQIETLTGLNQKEQGRGRSENLFEDSDLQMAGYAAALRVLTRYTHIDGVDMTEEATRPRTATIGKKSDKTMVDDMIDIAVQVANEFLVPERLDKRVWERLSGAERFYLRMLDIESAGGKKLDNYQNFAKAFRVGAWQDLMALSKANEARLKNAVELKSARLDLSAPPGDFSASVLRAVLYALMELQRDVLPNEALHHLRENVSAYYSRRDDLMALTEFLAERRERVHPEEASAARVLSGLLENETLGS